MTQTYRDSKIDQRARYTRAHVEKVAKGSQTIIRGQGVFDKRRREKSKNKKNKKQKN